MNINHEQSTKPQRRALDTQTKHLKTMAAYSQEEGSTAKTCDAQWSDARAQSMLEMLPKELLDVITESLDNVSRICLACTSPYLRDSILIRRLKLVQCEKWLLMCRFQRDSKEHQPSTLACNRCKTKHPLSRFVASESKQIWKGKRIDNARAFGDPIERYCWRQTMSTFWINRCSSHDSNPRRWFQRMELTCLHCRSLVTSLDGKPISCTACTCITCPVVRTPRYVRYGPPLWSTYLPVSVSLSRDRKGHLWINEQCGTREWKPFLVENGEEGPWTIQEDILQNLQGLKSS